jgi:hypothetical protein
MVLPSDLSAKDRQAGEIPGMRFDRVTDWVSPRALPNVGFVRQRGGSLLGRGGGRRRHRRTVCPEREQRNSDRPIVPSAWVQLGVLL